MMDIKRGDWVTCPSSTRTGFVRRVAKDGTWADVDWGNWTKRMKASVLEIQTTISVGNDMTITDITREDEIADIES